MRVLIKNGHILDPDTKLDGNYDILIEKGIIQKVDKMIEEEADRIIDAEGCYVMPGFVDLHVHLREPGFEGKETIKTGCKAAAKGGFTTICPMPNTMPVMDNGDLVRHFMGRVKKDAIVGVVPIGAVTKGQIGKKVADFSDMAAAGVKAISEDGKSVMDSKTYLAAMKKAKELNIPIFAHCEDKVLAGKGVINEGDKAKELRVAGISNTVEDVIAVRDIMLARGAGARLHLCHCSTRDSVSYIKYAKESGLPITGEVCPHHFTLTDADIPGDDANYKMNPPLRTSEDVEALKNGLKDNIMDVIATDHAPHTIEEKKKPIKEAPFGIVGLETAFSLTVTELVKQGYLTLMQMVEKLSYNPAHILGIDRGSLAVGKVADITIADLDAEYTIDAAEFVSKGRNTPFQGRKVSGRIEKTLVKGKIVYERLKTTKNSVKTALK